MRIQRRRQNWGLIEAATYYRVSLAKYAAWELDLHSDAPRVHCGMFSLAEVCFTLRIRAGIALEDVSVATLGTPVEELVRMENGEVPCAPLVTYWTEQGAL